MSNKIRRNVQDAEDRRAKRIATFLERLIADVEQVVEDRARVAKDIKTLPSVISEIGFLVQTLRSTGYENIADDLVDIHGVELTEVKRLAALTGIDINFLNADLQIAEALATFETERVFNKVAEHIEDSGRVLADAVVLGQTPKLTDVVDGLDSTLKHKLTTELNTGLASFSRSVNLKKAEDVGINLFLYTGGLIKTSRDFCIQRDGRVFTRAEINSWDNGQGLPAATYLGGYNCRHTLIPISERRAKELGFGK